MTAWIFLIVLLVFPWVAPTIERACSRYAGFVQPDASENEILEEEMLTSGHLQRAKAEGAGWFADALKQRRSMLVRLRS